MFAEFHVFVFFLNAMTAPGIYTYCHTLSLHAALPICSSRGSRHERDCDDAGAARRADGASHVLACRRTGRSLFRAGVARSAVAVRAQSADAGGHPVRSEEHTSELQSLMRNSYAVFCLKKKKIDNEHIYTQQTTH